MSAESIAIAYANNRTQLRSINGEISELICPSGDFENYNEIDLKPQRDEWLEDNYRWCGWEEAITNFSEETKDFDRELKLAELLDKKAGLRREAGQLKRNLCTTGRSLAKKQTI